MNRRRRKIIDWLPWFKNQSLALNGVSPSLIHDYGKNRYYDSAVGPRTFPFTATRTTNATMFNNAGQLVWAPANMIPQSSTAGAVVGVIGSGGALPTGWFRSTATGITHEVLAVAPDYIDVRIYGTNSSGGTAYPQISPLQVPLSIVPFESYSGSMTLSIIGGSTAGFSTAVARLNTQWLISGSYNNEASQSAQATATPTRLVSQGQSTATANQVRLSINLSMPTLGVVDITLRMGLPQVERQGVDSPKPYNQTTGTAIYCARRDHDPATLLPRGVLVEDARTNLIPASLNIPVSSMSELNVTRSVSPSTYLGDWTAIRVTANGLSTSHGAYPHSLAPTGSSVVGMHAIIKPISGGTFYQLTGSGSWMADLNGYANFDLTGDGSVTQVGASASTSFIEHLGGGVYFLGVSVTTTAAPSSAAACIIGLITSGTALRLPTNTSAAVFDYIYAGFYQSQSGWSSVIPTFGTTATRGADTLSAAADSWLTQGSGTIYAEFSHPTIATGIYPAILQIDDGTGNNLVQAFSQSNASTTSTGARIDLAGVAEVNTGVVNTVPYFDSNRYALSYTLNNTRMTLNGGAVVVDSVVAVPTGLTTYRPGGTQSVTTSARWIKELRFYPTASASNAQLQTLTT